MPKTSVPSVKATTRFSADVPMSLIRLPSRLKMSARFSNEKSSEHWRVGLYSQKSKRGNLEFVFGKPSVSEVRVKLFASTSLAPKSHIPMPSQEGAVRVVPICVTCVLLSPELPPPHATKVANADESKIFLMLVRRAVL